jgi:hypothetical protein
MSLAGSLICIFRGHRVSKQCQRSLKSSTDNKFNTKCETCGYPVKIEAIDKEKFYVTELNSAKEILQNKSK